MNCKKKYIPFFLQFIDNDKKMKYKQDAFMSINASVFPLQHLFLKVGCLIGNLRSD